MNIWIWTETYVTRYNNRVRSKLIGVSPPCDFAVVEDIPLHGNTEYATRFDVVVIRGAHPTEDSPISLTGPLDEQAASILLEVINREVHNAVSARKTDIHIDIPTKMQWLLTDAQRGVKSDQAVECET